MQILQNNIKSAEFIRTVWAAQPEPGTKLADMLLPEYWVHVAKTFRVGDRIDVTAADGSWFAELFVRSTSERALKVHVLRHIEFDKDPAEAPPALDIRHRGGAGWSVVRLVDKTVLFEGGKARSDAEDWVKANNLG